MRALRKIVFLMAYFDFVVLVASPVKAVIFDLDGTLIDNSNGYFLDWQYALKQQDYELMPEPFWQFMDENELVGAPAADPIIAQYCVELCEEGRISKLLEDKEVFSANLHASHHFPFIEATVRFVHQLAQEKEGLGIKIGLASGSSKEVILRSLKKLHIEDCFDLIISGYDELSCHIDSEGFNKPKPYIYLHAARILGFSPEECVAIEDSKTGVVSAKNAHYKVVAIPNQYTRAHNLSQADWQIESFEEITPIDFLEKVNSIPPLYFK